MSCEGPWTNRSDLARWLATFGLVAGLTMGGDAAQAQPGAAVETRPAQDAASADEAAPPATADESVVPPADESTDESERAWYDSVTVTAARTTLDRTDVPANVSVLEDEIRESAALTIDAVLRQVPGFATLRQQSSVVASVTSQGVSLR